MPIKNLTKKLKNRIKFLRNIRLKQEASEINLIAANKENERLYKKFKAKNTTFKNIKSSTKCEPATLTEHFSKHFNRETQNTA